MFVFFFTPLLRQCYLVTNSLVLVLLSIESVTHRRVTTKWLPLARAVGLGLFFFAAFATRIQKSMEQAQCLHGERERIRYGSTNLFFPRYVALIQQDYGATNRPKVLATNA